MNEASPPTSHERSVPVVMLMLSPPVPFALEKRVPTVAAPLRNSAAAAMGSDLCGCLPIHRDELIETLAPIARIRGSRKQTISTTTSARVVDRVPRNLSPSSATTTHNRSFDHYSLFLPLAYYVYYLSDTGILCNTERDREAAASCFHGAPKLAEQAGSLERPPKIT